MLRSFNGWLGFLHCMGLWPEWDRFVRGFRSAAQLLEASLVLLPSCTDVGLNQPDCILCKSNCLVHRQLAFGEVSANVLEDANLLVFAHKEMSEPACIDILKLKPAAVTGTDKSIPTRRSSCISQAETEELR
jgi:hypothetical protein